MSQAPIAVAKQLTSRLENSTASERLDTLQELQTLARTEAKLIGQYALQRVLDFLREQGSVDEYQEILDLIDRLSKHGIALLLLLIRELFYPAFEMLSCC